MFEEYHSSGAGGHRGHVGLLLKSDRGITGQPTTKIVFRGNDY